MEQEEEIGFTIKLADIKHHFKCSSEMEFLGWIQVSLIAYFPNLRLEKNFHHELPITNRPS